MALLSTKDQDKAQKLYDWLKDKPIEIQATPYPGNITIQEILLIIKASYNGQLKE